MLHITTAAVYNVRSDDNRTIGLNDTESGESLEYYASKYFSSNSQFYFKMGHHYLNTDLVIQNVTNVTLTGESLCIIRCTSNYASISILNVTNFRLQNIAFQNCSTHYNNYLHTDTRHDIMTISKLGNASILFYDCMLVEVTNITITISEGNTAMMVINVRNYSSISNIRIIAQIICPPVNNSSLQTNGIMLYFNNLDNPYNYSSQIQLDNFQFTTNGSCTHPIYYAISTLLFQNNANVSIAIQNTIFTNLVNVAALYYYGEMCGIAVSNHLTVQNCTVSNNTGNPSFNMLHIVLHNIQCIRLFKSTQLYYIQQHTHVRFINCKFENNFNMASMIYISPASSRATTGYFYLEKNTFHDNRNANFIIMKSDTDNLWQLSNYVVINNTNITTNSHDNSQDLMSFTNSWVWFNGPILIMDNHYYTRIANFHLSTCTLHYIIIISDNIARQIFSGSFIIVSENTTINVTGNTVYILLNQVLTYSINSEPICQIQFYTKLDFFNFSQLSIHLSMSNNIHMNSKYLPNFKYDCRWLSGNAFQKAGLHPKFVFNKTFHADNNIAISNISKRLIPLSICQCTKSSYMNHVEYDHKPDCYSPHLGSIFPGQTLKVELMIQKQWLYNNSSVPIVVYNTEEDDCSVVNTFQLYQTPINHECNSYSYTVWPRDETIHICEFFIGLQNMPEMFYVEFKHCPLGFTLQEDRKSCYCDPVLGNNEVISITSCNLSDETILRPAYSWISAKRDDNTKNTTYIVSSYCPFEHCLPYQSYHILSNPDSQCQFNRTGLLCGKCQQGLSTVLGSGQCKCCSDIYLLLIVPLAISGIVLVVLLYIFNLTVSNGTVNTCVFYINILNINKLMIFPDCRSFTCVILSSMNFEFRTTSCFYNGMDDYAKQWIYLVYPFYLISIAIVFIILSRYSITVQKFTARKALPVLATLFLFSYTKILVIVCNVLFRYSTVTHLPSNETELVWTISKTTPLFGVKFLGLFIVSIILFLILLPFNLILLFTRKLSCLRLITTFKPILDTYFGPYKDSAYYWTGLLLLIRGIVYVLLVNNEDMSLIVIPILLGCLLCLHATVQPFKNKLYNVQECVTILNLLAVHVVLLYKKNLIGLKIATVLITIGVIYFILAIVLHCCMYRCNLLIHKRLLFKIYKIKSICPKIFNSQNNHGNEMDNLNNRKEEVPRISGIFVSFGT